MPSWAWVPTAPSSIDASTPATDALPEMRSIAPEQVPVRFDARYFAVRMDDGADPVRTAPRRRRPGGCRRDLLVAWEAEEVRLYWPTHYTMHALADRRDADDVLGLRLVTREPDEDELGRLPRSVFFQDR